MLAGSPLTPTEQTQNLVSLQRATPEAAGTTQDQLVNHLNDPHWYDVAGATFMRENTVMQLAAAMGANDGFGADETVDSRWSAYSYFLRHRDQYADIEHLVARGEFDGVRGELAFKKKAFVAREMAEYIDIQSRGGLGGQLAGMGLSMFDVTSLASFGALGKLGKGASMLQRLGRGAAVGAADAAVQEAALQYMDPTRSAEESFMAIGSSAFLGAGLNSVFRHMPPDSRLHPDHPENPLKPENLGKDEVVLETRLGQTPEEGVTVSGFNSAGAAAVDTTGTELARGTGLGGMTQKAFDGLLSWGTPLARMPHYLPGARQALLQLVDTGGRLTRAMARGDAHAPEAESLRTVYMQKARATQTDIADIYRQANMALGQSAANTKLKTIGTSFSGGLLDRNALPRSVFDRAVFDEQSAFMLNNVNAKAEIVADLKKAGLDDAEAETAYGHVRQAAQRNMQFLEELKDDAIRTGMMDPDLDLKGAYGLPVQYVRSAINGDRAGFKSLLFRLLSEQPDDEWLNAHMLTLVDRVPDGVDANGAPRFKEEPRFKSTDELKKDPAAWADTLREWAGDNERAMRDSAEEAFASAQRKLDSATEQFDMVADGVEGLRKDLKTRGVAVMRAKVFNTEANLWGRTLGSAQRKAEQAEAKLNDLLARAPDIEHLYETLGTDLKRNGHDVDAAFSRAREARKQTSEAQSLVDALKGEKAPLDAERLSLEPQVREDWTAARDHAEATRAVTEINAQLREAFAVRRQAQEELMAAQRSLESVSREQRNLRRWQDAVAKEAEAQRATALDADGATRLKTILEGQADRLAEMKRYLHEAEQARQFVSEQFRLARKGLATTRKEFKAAQREARATKRRMQRLDKGTPLGEYVDRLTNALSGQDTYPAGLLMDKVVETGRLKERRFKWTKDLWRELADKGFVESDTAALTDRYARDMGGRLALQKSFGHQNVEDVLRGIQSAYDDELGKITDPKLHRRTTVLRDKALADVRASWDRVLGRHEVMDDTAPSWLASKLGNLGFIRFAGGFVFSAMGDIATAMHSTPGFLRGIKKAHGEYRDILTRAAAGDADARELKMILQSFESGAHMASAIRSNGGTVRDHVGFGTGMTREVSARVDKVLNLVGDKVNTMSGLAMVSDGTRRVAGLVQLGNIYRWTKDYANLKPGQRTDLAALGIGKHEAQRIAELFKKHGTQHGSLMDPGMSKWLTEPDGDYMADILNTALVKTQQRASYTQGFGNMPLLMDNAYGKLFLQFQSYAYQYTNNFVLAGVQRGAVTGDYLRLAQTMGMAFAMAGVTSAIRAYMRNENPDDWDNSKWVNEIISRSGILGWSQPYADATVKLFGHSINEQLGGNYLQAPSKFQQNNWAESLLGPWFGTFGQLTKSVGDLATGDLTKAGEKAMKLIPLNQQINLLNMLSQAEFD